MALPNLVYFGSPDFSAQILSSIIDSKLVNVVGVVTQPDKPLGRKQIVTPSPVAQIALDFDLPTYKPSTLDEANLSHLKLLKPDIFMVISYGKIIPQSWLDLPKIATFNIHFSLLPKYRGALCMSEALKNGDPETGVTFMIMDSQLDHGPIISQSKVKIDVNDNVSSLTEKLTTEAIDLIKQDLPKFLDGSIKPIPQDESQAIYTPKTREHTHQSSFIDFNLITKAQAGDNALEIHNLIRSLNPEPGAWTTIKNKDIKIIRSTLDNNNLVIETIQLSGKSPVSWKQFESGYLN